MVISGIAAPTASAGGPFWHVGGSKFTQGTRQLELQNKGNAVLKSEIALIRVEIECGKSKSEGAAIEGSGQQKPGQDKGRLRFEECVTKVAGNTNPCKVVEPIITNQTKSILGTSSEATQKKYVDIFEPQQGATFVELTLENNIEKCPVPGTFPVKGAVAAELAPTEAEAAEGSLIFPETAIKKAQVFSQASGQPEERATNLFLGANAAKFKAFYKAKLATNEVWGVFPT
ncbi:MAG TPA: hypothetical protein VGY76_01275 [Solirubrobacteraceae bacterium]|nr:hypothetical protein [Solirubrobacteraceae bacterium]